MSESKVSVTIRRPVPTIKTYAENGRPVSGMPFPKGTVFTFDVEDGVLLDCSSPDQKPCGPCEWDSTNAIHAAADVPCPHLYTDWDDTEGSTAPGWFGCTMYDNEAIPNCLGDMARCPFGERRVAPEVKPLSNHTDQDLAACSAVLDTEPGMHQVRSKAQKEKGDGTQ